MVDPGLVPQPPVQFNDTSEHWFGSENPSCAAVRLVPNGEFPSTVRLADPLRFGSVACTAPNASARPMPNVLSGFGLLKMTAWPRRRLRSVVRAVEAAIVDVVRLSRHGAPCKTSAAMPPRCGDPADVPKNVVPNPPAPVTLTPSTAVMSGLDAPVERRPTAAEKFRRSIRR